MTVFEAFWLGLFQGITEFLPVSSSGHLALLHAFMNEEGGQAGQLCFDVLLHLATLVAVVGYFWRDWLRFMIDAMTLVRSRRIENSGQRLVCLVGLASLPAAVAGLFLADAIEAFFYGFGATGRIGLMFFITGAAFWFAERRVQKMRAMDTLTWRDAGIIGGCQALALLPGISRSGSTMVAALFLGLNRADAARFSFLLAVPVTLGAALLKLPQMFELGQVGFSPALTGFLTALISALLSIHYLLRLLKTHTFMVFAWYLLIIGAVSMASAWIVL